MPANLPEAKPQQDPRLQRSLLRTAALVLAIGLGLGSILGVQRMVTRLVFPYTKDVYRDPSAFGWPFENIMLDVGRHKTHAWYIPQPHARGTVLFSHGNAGNIADRLESVDRLRDLGFSVLVYDYGGYGRSTGRPSEARCYADIRAAWDWLMEEKRIPPEEVVLFGRSLGGGPTAHLAQEVRPAAVVLESTFQSIPAVAAELIPWLPVGWLVRDRFESIVKVRNITSPLLLIHSPDDTLIRFHHGQALFDAANEPKTFLEIKGPHNTGFVESWESYRKGWEAFLEPILPRNAQAKE